MPFSPVYSSQFIVWGPGTPNTSFDVPEDKTADIRQITLWISAGGQYVTTGFRNSLAAPINWFSWLGGITLGNSAAWTGRVVVPGGGQIAIDTDGIAVSTCIYVGGYLFSNSPS